MGWGEASEPSDGAKLRQLAIAVRTFLEKPTTGNQERLAEVVDRVDPL